MYVVQLTVIKSLNCIDDHPLTSLKICRKSGNYIAPSRYHSGDFALNTLTQRCRLHGSGPSMGWVGSIVKFKKKLSVRLLSPISDHDSWQTK